MGKSPIIAAYYYPGWHASEGRQIRGGTTEWELLYDDVSRRAYPHVRRPLEGAVEPSVQSIEAEIGQAMTGGIDSFWWCWYWDRGRLLLNEALDMFLHCRIPADFRYALMWVNKRPHFRLPAEAPWSKAFDRSRLIETDEDDFAAMIRHLIERHFERGNYLRVDDRPVLSIFSIEPLIRQHGVRRLRELLAMGQRMARVAGLRGIHYVAVIHRAEVRSPWLRRLGLAKWARPAPLREIGFSAVTTYIYLPDWEGPQRQNYAQLVEKRAAEWPRFKEKYELSFWPSVAPGWDARVRGVPLDPLPAAHPWSPVIEDETPGAFESWLGHWKELSASEGGIPVLPVCSWNEWTEGHAVAPCTRHGDAMLAALRRFKDSFSPAAATRTAASGTR